MSYILKTVKRLIFKKEDTQNVLSAVKVSQITSITYIAQICNLDEPYVIKILRNSIAIANALPPNKKSDVISYENLRFLRNANINKHTSTIILDPNALEIHTRLGVFVKSLFGNKNDGNSRSPQTQQLTFNVDQSRNLTINSFSTNPQYCSKCGNELLANANACHNCGTLIAK